MYLEQYKSSCKILFTFRHFFTAAHRVTSRKVKLPPCSHHLSSLLKIDGLFPKLAILIEFLFPFSSGSNQVQCASEADVDTAVEAASTAFNKGEWSKISSRDRGVLMNRLADLMEAHKEELATLESMDSGAVYTLALKTHIGMSIETWRYFAGWTDKIQGSTIPISHARPNHNLTYTVKEPFGCVALDSQLMSSASQCSGKFLFLHCNTFMCLRSIFSAILFTPHKNSLFLYSHCPVQ